MNPSPILAIAVACAAAVVTCLGPRCHAADSFPVTVTVDAANSTGPLRPIWRYFGADEPNYATMKDGQKLLGQLGELAPKQVFFRAHNLLCTGDGTPAFGAFDGARLVGSVRSRVDGERMEVARLAVAPDVQGGGVGRRLLEAVSTRVPVDVRVVWLFTGAESDGNLSFYESAGFVRVGEHLDAVGIRCVTLEQKVI